MLCSMKKLMSLPTSRRAFPHPWLSISSSRDNLLRIISYIKIKLVLILIVTCDDMGCSIYDCPCVKTFFPKFIVVNSNLYKCGHISII